jgi:hypothetical protein
VFNAPPLIEAADSGPFFHNNAVDTIEEAVAFYNSDAFNDDAANLIFIREQDSGGIGIKLDASAVTAVASFLRVLNAIENLRQAKELENTALGPVTQVVAKKLVNRALDELEDANDVLTDVKLQPKAILHIRKAIQFSKVALAAANPGPFTMAVNQAIGHMNSAKSQMVAP